MEDKVLIEVKDLKKYFKTSKGMLHAVDGINFKIKKGTTLGVVGESGCGKSTQGYYELSGQTADGSPQKDADDFPGPVGFAGSEKKCKGSDWRAAEEL